MRRPWKCLITPGCLPSSVWHRSVRLCQPGLAAPVKLQYAVAGLLKSRAAWEVLDSGLFDSDWYLRRYPDLAEKRVDGLWHFLAHGMHEDRDPGPGFSSSGYRARYLARDADVPRVSAVAPAISALGDYLRHGREQGFEPLPIFEGTLTLRASAPTVLVCAHLAGPYLFGAEISFLDVLDALKRLGINVLVSLPGVHHLGIPCRGQAACCTCGGLAVRLVEARCCAVRADCDPFSALHASEQGGFCLSEHAGARRPDGCSESAEPVGYRSCAGVARARFDTLRDVGG
jgi:hypothetical protein